MQSHIIFALVEAVLIGAQYVPASLIPPLLGMVMFWGGVAGLVIYPAWRLWQIRKRMEPHHLVILGLAGVLVFVAITLAGVVWQAQTPGGPSADLQTKMNELQATYEKYVRPRELSDEQIVAIGEFLLKRPPQKISVIFEVNNGEANHYTAQIHRAFEMAHWESRLLAADKDTRLLEGVRYDVKYPPGSTDKNIPDDIRRAFQAASAPLGGGGSGQTSKTGELYVEMIVGHRPRR